MRSPRPGLFCAALHKCSSGVNTYPSIYLSVCLLCQFVCSVDLFCQFVCSVSLSVLSVCSVSLSVLSVCLFCQFVCSVICLSVHNYYYADLRPVQMRLLPLLSRPSLATTYAVQNYTSMGTIFNKKALEERYQYSSLVTPGSPNMARGRG